MSTFDAVAHEKNFQCYPVCVRGAPAPEYDLVCRTDGLTSNLEFLRCMNNCTGFGKLMYLKNNYKIIIIFHTIVESIFNKRDFYLFHPIQAFEYNDEIILNSFDIEWVQSNLSKFNS